MYLIFWGSHWSNQSGISSDGQLVEQYFQDVGGTPFENILTQYKDSNAPVSNALQYGGAWIDTSAPPTDLSCVQPTVEDASIQSEVVKAISANNWPENGNVTFFVYTPPSMAVNSSVAGGCSSKLYVFKNAYCGYHFYLNSIGVAYAEILYPNSTSPCEWRVPQSPNNDKAADSLINVTSHEQFEAITDPQPQVVNGALTSSGWKDSNGSEIGDKCAWQFPSTPTKLNNGGVFELQYEYSNATSACVNTYTAPSVYASSSNGVYAFDPTTGVRLWRYLAPCNVSSPVVSSGMVYFNACNTVYALSAAAPTLLWSTTLGGTAQGAPLLGNGLMYVNGSDGNLYAFTPTSGALAWKVAVNGGQPVLGNGVLFVPSGAVVLALDASTGAQLWQASLPAGVSYLEYGNGTVFASGWTSSGCYWQGCPVTTALDASTGYVIWSNGYDSPGAEANGVFYQVSGGSLLAWDDGLGTHLWTDAISTTANINGTPTIANGEAYVGLSDGTIAAVNISSGVTTWTYASGAAISNTPVVNNGALYAGSGSTVTALDATAGTLRWTAPTVSGISGSPAVFAPTLAVDKLTVTSRGVVGSNPPSQSVMIENTGVYSLNWQVSGTLPPWLQVTPSSGTVAPGQSQHVTLSFALGTLSQVQAHSATLVLADSSATNSPLKVQVHALITPSNTVYASSSNEVYAFDPASGTQLWRYLAPCAVSQPALVDGLVIFSACGTTLYALDASSGASSGTLKWKYTFPSSVHIASVPVPSASLLYVNASDGNLYAFTPTSGALAWKVAVNGGQPVLGNGVLFVPSGAVVLALDASTGAQLWQASLPAGVSYLEYGNGTVFASGWTSSGCYWQGCPVTTALDASTGYVIWSNGYDSPGAEANGVFYQVSGGSLLAWDDGLGTHLWTDAISTTANINGTPTIANGEAYVGLSDGTIAAVNISSGVTTWTYASGAAISNTPVVNNGALYAGSGSTVTALDATAGTLRWTAPTVSGISGSPVCG